MMLMPMLMFADHTWSGKAPTSVTTWHHLTQKWPPHRLEGGCNSESRVIKFSSREKECTLVPAVLSLSLASSHLS